MAKKFLTAAWHHLIMANYEIDPELLKSYVPKGTELDLWNGRCYVSLVGFMFLKTKLLGIPIPFHRNFEEVNLRFYVRYQHEGEWRRGVVFVKEIVPKFMISNVANTVYGEHYQTLRMKHHDVETEDGLEVGYYWKFQKKWNYIKVKAEKTPQPIPEGSEAEFITEHYWGYTKINENTTSQYQVEHPRWDFYPVTDYEISCNAKALYGEVFGGCMAVDPVSVFMAKGSDIAVLPAGKLKF